MPTPNILMRRALRRRTFLLEGLKVLVLAAILYAVQNQILGIRYDLHGNRTRIATAEERHRKELDEAERQIEQALKDCTADLESTRQELEVSLERFDGERRELKAFLAERTVELKDSILDRLDSDRNELLSTRSQIETQSANLRELSTLMKRDPEVMKRKMILPTTQLKGNGTVGSGVIVYSESQPDVSEAERTVATTFVLTAYHVVVEVLGDRFDRGLLTEVHVLLEGQPDTTEVFTAKLVLFDRARDIALLRLNTEKRFRNTAEWLPVSEFRRIDVFARAYAVGCPLGNRPMPTLGEISSRCKVVGDQTFWMLSAPTFFGNSGGGVYLAENCDLIGVSSMIYTYGKTNPTVVPHMGLFVPLDTVYAWLDSEGYSFVYQRRPIPKEMLWKLVYLERSAPVPRAATGSRMEAQMEPQMGPQVKASPGNGHSSRP